MNPTLRYFIDKLCKDRGSIAEGNSCYIYKTIADQLLIDEPDGVSIPTTIRNTTFFVVVDTNTRECVPNGLEIIDNQLSMIYTKQSWLKANSHYVGLKVASEKSRQNRDLVAAARVVMTQAISRDELLGTMLGKEQIEIMVESIIRKERFDEAAKWGVTNLKEILE